MARIKYSTESDPDLTSKAMGTELHISPKHSAEICRAIKNMPVEKAKQYLSEVMAKKKAVPFKKHKRKVGHKKGLGKWDAGRYPVKATSAILKLIENAENNATYKGQEPEKMRIIHIGVHKGRKIRGAMPRAFGRATPKDTETVNIEVIIG